MSTRRTKSPTKKSRAKPIEWSGGIVQIPGTVQGESEPFSPAALFWMGADGKLLGHLIDRSQAVLARAAESLQIAMDDPAAGRPHRPSTVRVASEALAEAVRRGHPGLEVIVAPTPELDEALAGLVDSLAGSRPGPYLTHGHTPEAMSAFFDATATMYRAAPWRVVPADCVFSVTVGALDIHDFALAVIGEAGRDGGWLVFPGLDAFEELMEQVDAYEPGDDVEPPPHLALHFEAASELPPGLWSEAEDNRWALANPAAYPRLVVVGEAGRLHPPAPEDVVLAEAVSRALTHAVAEKGALLAAFEAGEPMTRTFSVATEQGDLDVTLTAPFLHPSHLLDPSGDLIEALAELTEDGELDLDAYQALEQAVSDRFEASPEAEGLELKYLYRTVMEFGAQYLGETIATLSADALGELLFEVFPRKLSIDPKEAGAIIDETRALYRFLQREFDLPQAKACLSVLGPSSARRLEAALADKSKYGMAKAMVMAGLDAGVDMSSQESLEAWMRSMEGKPLPPSIPLPAVRVAAPSKKAVAAKKAKRKAARKARKRNK